MILFKTWLRHV